MRAIFLLSLCLFADAGTIQDYIRATVCTGRTIPAFYLVQDASVEYRLGIDSFRGGISEADCLGFCADNKKPQSTNRKLCGSLSYNEVTKTCALSKFQVGPNGPASIVEKAFSRYYEKFCLSRNVPAGCGEAIFYRHAQTKLIGFAFDHKEPVTMTECVNACAQSEKCRSVMYYYDDEQCILNSENAHDYPEFFYKEDTDKVVYIENGCTAAKAEFSTDGKGMTKAVEESTPMEESKEMGTMEKPMDKSDMMEKEESMDDKKDMMDEKEGMEMKKEMEMEKEMDKSKTMMQEPEMLSQWTDWGQCDSDSYSRRRTRLCLSKKCTSPLMQEEACPHLSGWSAWSQPCQQFSFKVKEKCLGFKVRVCMGDKANCQGPHYKYCFRC